MPRSVNNFTTFFLLKQLENKTNRFGSVSTTFFIHPTPHSLYGTVEIFNLRKKFSRYLPSQAPRILYQIFLVTGPCLTLTLDVEIFTISHHSSAFVCLTIDMFRVMFEEHNRYIFHVVFIIYNSITSLKKRDREFPVHVCPKDRMLFRVPIPMPNGYSFIFYISFSFLLFCANKTIDAAGPARTGIENKSWQSVTNSYFPRGRFR